MINWSNCSIEEIKKISKVVQRAIDNECGYGDKCTMLMDLQATHMDCPLDLEGLLEAQISDLSHDILGIATHLNRQTGELEDCFSPRYSVH